MGTVQNNSTVGDRRNNAIKTKGKYERIENIHRVQEILRAKKASDKSSETKNTFSNISESKIEEEKETTIQKKLETRPNVKGKSVVEQC